MRKLIGFVALVAFLLAGIATAKADEVQLEEGATFDGGICWEADGTEGIATIDGQCMTPADYDEMFSYENLEATPMWRNPEVSVAEAYGITPDSPKASDRAITFMGENLGTFTEIVFVLHNGIVGL